MSGDMSPPPTPSALSPVTKIEPRILYLLVSLGPSSFSSAASSATSTPPPEPLSDIDPCTSSALHWSLFMSPGTSDGNVLEAAETNGRWAFSSTNYSIAHMQALLRKPDLLLLVLKLADVEDMLRPALCGRASRVLITKTNRFGAFTSRTWFMQVLFELENEGYIELKMTPQEIEAEAALMVSANMELAPNERALIRTSSAFKSH